MKKLDQTEAELKRIIEETLGSDLVDRIRVTPYVDHAGEPALSVGVSMKSANDIPDSRRQSDLTRRLVLALAELEEARFPYLYFDSVDGDAEPDDVDEFESFDDDTGHA